MGERNRTLLRRVKDDPSRSRQTPGLWKRKRAEAIIAGGVEFTTCPTRLSRLANPSVVGRHGRSDRATERGGDAGEPVATDRRAAVADRLDRHAHQILQPLDLPRREPNSPLPLGPGLEELYRHRPAAEDEQAPPRPAEPVVEGGRRDP